MAVDGPLDRVAKLAAVALGEGLNAEVGQGVVGQLDLGAHLGSDRPREPAGLGFDVVGTLAKRRDRHRQAFDPGEERQRQFARTSALGPGLGLDRQHDGTLGLSADLLLAEPAELAVFEEGMQDRRAGGRQAVKVIEQNHPLSGRGDQSGAVLAGVGEGPALVAEEDRAEERLVGQLVAGGHGQRVPPPLGRGVEDRRQPPLAGAALTVEHQAGQRFTHPACGPRGRARLGTEQPRQSEDLRERRTEGVGLVDESLIGHRLGERLDRR